MNVLVDTSVWSEILRRKGPKPHISAAFRSLVIHERVQIIGAIRQETLSGIRRPEVFERLKNELAGFKDIALGVDH